jgi:membrane complex biogenesis BtpA family protein
MGIWNNNPGDVFRYRKMISAQDIAIFFNISAEFAYNLDRRPQEAIAKSVEFSSLADVILISGPMTGHSPTAQSISIVKEQVSTPVFTNTGLKAETVDEILGVADGAIVGTSIKKDGITWNEIDPKRVSALMDKVRSVRERS